MKKIVLCIPNLLTGGAEKFVVDLAENIDVASYDVCVAITRNGCNSDFKCRLQTNGIRVVDLSAKNYLQMTRKQLRFFKQEKPDVVHANIGAVLHIMLATKLARIPNRIFTLHNEAKLLHGGSLFKKVLYRLAFGFFGFVPIAICDFVKKTLMLDFGYSSDKVPVVRNGVNTINFPLKEKQCNEMIELVTTGTVYWIKNQMAIVQATEKLSLRHPNIHLTILGDGEDFERVREYVASHSLDKFISMPGRCNNVAEYLQHSDIYVSASLTEGLPLSILEAMSTGLPIVATDAGGTVDIVKNNVNGIIIPKDSGEALIDALEKMIVEREFREKCGDASRTTAEQWDMKQCLQGYQELYSL